VSYDEKSVIACRVQFPGLATGLLIANVLYDYYKTVTTRGVRNSNLVIVSCGHRLGLGVIIRHPP
jgi:hypothetical protein